MRVPAQIEVLFLIPTLRGGGAERVIVTLLRNIDRKRFRVTLAVVDMTDAVFKNDLPADIEVIDLKSTRVRQALQRIVKLIWRRRPDVVFSTLSHLNLAIATARVLLPNDVRYIAREATVLSRLPTAYPIPRWWLWLYRRFYRRFDKIVCQSSEMRRDLVEGFGIPLAKTIVIYNPVDAELVRRCASEQLDIESLPDSTKGRMAETVKLVAVGSLTYVKGIDVLIEALALCPRGRFKATIIGDGPLRGSLADLAQAKGLSEEIQFTGFRSNPYPYIKRADALVLSSRFEGFPNVVLEALACGVPVVALPCPGGIREIIESLRGCVLAEDCTAAGLAQALGQFDFRQRIPQDAVDKYAISNVVTQYEQLFLNAARKTFSN